ncbi:MAG: hypothetical protein PWQ07_725 [Kosmotoga sp.]|nr:hypothetical protein [Kosmotoga sp.]
MRKVNGGKMMKLKILIIFGVCLIMFSTGFSEKIALVLSGGGGRGAYEVGVWKAVMDLGEEIGGVYGTSVGAINGAGVAMGEFELARKLWLTATYEDIMKISPNIRPLFEGDIKNLKLSSIAEAVKMLFEESGIDVSPLRKKLSEIISEEKIRSSPIDYGLVAYSVSSLSPVMLYIDDIPEGMLIDYILASANFPVFKRENIGGAKFIDGGVYANIPVEMAIKKGFKKIVVVDIGTYGIVDILNLIKGFTKSDEEIIYIKPREYYGGILTFDPEVSKKYMAEGYLDTLKAYGILHGNVYYIYPGEDLIGKFFMSLDDQQRAQAMAILEIKPLEDAPVAYHYYRQVLPYLESAFKTFNAPPRKTCEAVLENIASYLEINKLRPYSIEELFKTIVNSDEPQTTRSTLLKLTVGKKYDMLIEFLKFIWNNSKHDVEISEDYKRIRSSFESLITIP